ncbi:mCG147850 [Mus musculus]|nr:mCG147850 [Mus musculus]
MGIQSLRATSPDTTVALLLGAYGPLEKGNQAMQYWPFSLADLYNWKAQPPPLSQGAD